MGKASTRFLQAIRRFSRGKKLTEAVATQSLSRWLFQGHGKTHLSLPVCEDGIGRSPNSKPYRFSCPDTPTKYARWAPLRDHILGDHKGIVADENTKLVPFIAVDLDRHSGFVSSERHQQIAVQIGRNLRRIPHIKWIAEVNPRNGSTKFFGFRRSGEHFSLKDAQELASRIRQSLIKANLCHDGNIEVFPDNCKAVFLPLRRDKLSIADRGIMPRYNRKIKDVRFFGQTVWEQLRCYSPLHFVNWIYQGDNYDEATFISALRYACAGLADESENDIRGSEVTEEPGIARSPAGGDLASKVPARLIASTRKSHSEEPNAFTRNWNVLLPFVRKFFKVNKRLPLVEEALSFLRSNGLFSGEWVINVPHRRKRVGDILNKIAETFDPSLLQGKQAVHFDRDVWRWCRRQCRTGLVANRRFVIEPEMRTVVRTLKVPARFVEHCVCVIAFCLDHPLNNNALPVKRVNAIWNLAGDAPSWNQTYFQVVRDWLEGLGVVDIYDKNHEPGKAWRWKKGPSFPKRRRAENSSCSSEAGQGRLAESKATGRPSTGGAREWMGKGIRKEEIHNSLYHLPIAKSPIGLFQDQYRGPPDSIPANAGPFHYSFRCLSRP